jgi:hypothetical protein
MAYKTTVHGIYHGRKEAEEAISWMCSDGFRLSDISILRRSGSGDRTPSQEIETNLADLDANARSLLNETKGIGPFLSVGSIAIGDIVISVDCRDSETIRRATDLLKLTGAEDVSTSGPIAGAA